MPWSDALEYAAKEGNPLPDGLTAPEKAMYISMRGLYWQVQAGVIDIEHARKEKRALLNDLCRMELENKAREKSVKAWRWVDLNLNKCTCPECAALKKAILGLDNIM